jgi:WD40 repeat protein
VRTGSFNRDGTLIVTTSDDNAVRIWDADSGEPLGQLPLPRPGRSTDYTTSAEFSPDGKSIVVSRSDGLVAIMDGKNYNNISVLQDKGPTVLSARFSRDGRRIVTASENGSVFIWDLNSGAKLPLPRQLRSVSSASFSPDGLLVVTASSDWTARIWDTRTLSQLFVFKGHTGVVTAAEFSPAASRL